jgi:ParB-like chromosome segregation protein Spo0J
MRYEAEDIPKELIEKGIWIQEEINLSEIQIEKSILEEHDNNPIHIKRRDKFIKSIEKGMPILPLIILNCARGERYLVDGYARYRALKSIGIKTIFVLKQEL